MKNATVFTRWCIYRATFFIGLFFNTFTNVQCSAQSTTEHPPNVLVIVADDMGFSDPGFMGSRIKTPHLDALAAKGKLFTKFYNNTKCNPTRASLLTGLYAPEAGLRNGAVKKDKPGTPNVQQGYLSPQALTMATALGSQGYQTFLSGKWHLGQVPGHFPWQRGFDRFYGLLIGASSYYGIHTDPAGNEQIPAMAFDGKKYLPPDSGFYATNAYTDKAIDFLEERKSQQPFFLYMAYTAPHWPLHALPAEIEPYRGTFDEGWQKLRPPRWYNMVDKGMFNPARGTPWYDPKVREWDSLLSPAFFTARMEVYAAMLSNLDSNIGRLVSYLKSTGQYENTIILFFSDNGSDPVTLGDSKHIKNAADIGKKDTWANIRFDWAWYCNTPFRGFKGDLYEGGIRSPLLVHWPKGIKEAGIDTSHIIHTIDIAPTLYRLTGFEYPDTYEGRTLKPLKGMPFDGLLSATTNSKANETQARNSRPLYWEFTNKLALREGPWKLIYFAETGKSELFNLDIDPYEKNNLSQQYPLKTQQYTGQVIKWWGNVVGNFIFDKEEVTKQSSVYPNPVKQASPLFVNLSEASLPANIKVYTQQGHLVLEKTITRLNVLKPHFLSQMLTPGLYHIVFNVDGQQVVRRLVVTP